VLLCASVNLFIDSAKLNIKYQTTKKMEEKIQKIRPALTSLEIGETIEFPIIKLKSVRTQASELGIILSRQFTTRTDRATQRIYVTRVA
jgi:hypothetical protein